MCYSLLVYHVLQQPNILFQSYDFVQAIALTHHEQIDWSHKHFSFIVNFIAEILYLQLLLIPYFKIQECLQRDHPQT